MKIRRLKMPVDGRMFIGTPKEILSQMKLISFGWDGRTLAEYLDWLKHQMEQQTGAEINISGNDVATDCEALVDAMVAHGLALEILKGTE